MDQGKGLFAPFFNGEAGAGAGFVLVAMNVSSRLGYGPNILARIPSWKGFSSRLDCI
jgi:hypothetical protein